eukprot:6172073-Pleurochrysis_carterae.AAC.2
MHAPPTAKPPPTPTPAPASAVPPCYQRFRYSQLTKPIPLNANKATKSVRANLSNAHWARIHSDCAVPHYLPCAHAPTNHCGVATRVVLSQ